LEIALMAVPGKPSSTGQPDWFAVELVQAQSALYAYVSTLMAGSTDSYDVLQEANIVMWQKAGEVDSAAGFLPWAYSVARYQVMAYRKRVSRDRHVFSLGVLERLAERAASHHAVSEDEIAILEDCMAKLSAQQREYVSSRYSEGMAVQEIAQKMCQSENAVAATLYRARLVLAKCVEAKLADRGGP
jgi:RNA polymerase sigma-70 factor, ECF subfamily